MRKTLLLIVVLLFSKLPLNTALDQVLEMNIQICAVDIKTEFLHSHR